MDGNQQHTSVVAWDSAARLHIPLTHLTHAHMTALAPLIHYPWHRLGSISNEDRRRGRAAARAGQIVQIEAVVPDAEHVGIVATIRARNENYQLKLFIGASHEPRWRCSCPAAKEGYERWGVRHVAKCAHLLVALGWLTQHAAKTLLPKAFLGWTERTLDVAVARSLRDIGSAEVQFVLTAKRQLSATAAPPLLVRPEVVFEDGRVVVISGISAAKPKDKSEEAQAAAEAEALARVDQKGRDLLSHVRLMTPSKLNQPQGFSFDSSGLAQGVLSDIFAHYPVYWQRSASVPLKLTPMRPAFPVWSAAVDGTQHLEIRVSPARTWLFSAGGFVFLDEAAGEIGFVAGDAAMLEQLGGIPPVPLAQLGAIQEAWPYVVAPCDCPAPPIIPRGEAIDIEPLGEVTLDGLVEGKERFLFARLAYRYGAFLVAHTDPDDPVRCDGTTLRAIHRKRDAEADLLARFMALGWKPITVAPPELLSCDIASLRAKPIKSDAIRNEFMKMLPRIEEAGFRVQVTSAFDPKVIDARDATTTLRVGMHKDAIVLQADIEIDHVRYSLLHLVLAALKDTSGPLSATRVPMPDEMWSGVLNDDMRVRIPLERLRSLALPVVDWARGGPLLKDGRAVLPRARAIALLGEPGAEHIEGIEMIQTMADRQRSFDSPELHVIPETLAISLKPHQIEPFVFLNRCAVLDTGAGLFDGMGAGKTAVAIAHHLWRRANGHFKGPTLVIAPSTPMEAWRKDLPRFAPGERVLDLSRAGIDALPTVSESEIVLVTLTFLRDHVAALSSIAWGLIYIDEAHYLKNPESQVYTALAQLKRVACIPMTGTPIDNTLDDFYWILSLAVPGLFGSHASFVRRFRIPIEDQNCPEAIRALKRISEPFFIRRRTAEILPDLPPLTEEVFRIPIPETHEDFYSIVNTRLSIEARKAGFLSDNTKVIALLTDALLTASDPSLCTTLTASDPSLGTTLKVPLGVSPKFAVALARVRDAKARGQKILIFSRFKKTLHCFYPLLEADGLECTWITGDSTDRGDTVDAFQAGDFDVCLISTLAGNAGITLTRAERVLFLDHWWTDSVKEQAIARAMRLTQTKPVHVEHLLLAGSVDERVWAIQLRKQGLFDAVFGAGNVALYHLSEDDKVSLFGTDDIEGI